MTELDPATPDSDPQRRQTVFWGIVWLLIVCAVGMNAGRILDLIERKKAEGKLPFQSANDRSRWCTVRALVDEQTYELDSILAKPDGRAWDTIDKVRHLGGDQEFHYYSSKPPLLPTLMAAEYWLLKRVSRQGIGENPYFVVAWLLCLTHGIGLAAGMWMLAKIARYLCDDQVTGLVLVAMAGFGTFATPFGVTFSNHLPAAFCVIAVLFVLIPIWKERDSHQSLWAYAWLGFFAGLAAAFDLPALSFAVLAIVLAATRSFSRVLLGSIPAFLIVAAGFFATNVQAHGTWEMAYAHRCHGPVIETIDGDFEEPFNQGKVPSEVVEKLASHAEAPYRLSVGSWPGNEFPYWVVNFGAKDQLVLRPNPVSGDLEVRKWNNWYEYPGSYWLDTNPKKSEADRGEADRRDYLFHITLGHHGVLSLTPFWVLSLFGLIWLTCSPREHLRLPAFGWILVTLVVFAFYVSRKTHDRNYGGWTCCFRWAIWMYPVWLVSAYPVVRSFWQRKWLRWVLLALVLISVATASASLSNPWTRPWLESWFDWSIDWSQLGLSETPS